MKQNLFDRKLSGCLSGEGLQKTVVNYFSPISVPDASQAVAAALDIPAGIYNAVDDSPLPLAEYLRTLAGAIGVGKPIHLPAILWKWMFGEVWKFLSRSSRVSNARLKEVSNWKPQ